MFTRTRLNVTKHVHHLSCLINYLKRNVYSMYYQNATFCPYILFTLLLWVLEQVAIVSIHINYLAFIIGRDIRTYCGV